jgi:hypothetical protein
VARRRRSSEKTTPLDPQVEKVVKLIKRAEEAYHTTWETEVDQRHDEYHAIVTVSDDQPEWQSKIFQPHLIPIIEGMIASMVEPNPKLIVRPRPRPRETPDEAMARTDTADVAEVAVNYALEQDRFRMKQRPYMQQDMITGLTVGKYSWEEINKKVWTREFHEEEEYDDETGEYERVRAYTDIETEEKIRDDPTFTVLDVRDFYWPANCRDVDQADWLGDRQYLTHARIQEMEDAGIYDKGVCAKLKETSLDKSGNLESRTRYDEGGSEGPTRTRGLVEVIEVWWNNRVVTVGNRTVLMRNKPNGFWSGNKPYIVCGAIPNFGQVNGKSIVETLAPIQKMLWFIQNQRLDNLKLLNNLIYLIRSDSDDISSFKWYPGAQWLVDDPDQVRELPIDPTPANISLEAESLLMGQLQNLMGGMPYSSGAQSTQVDQKTATGIQIITDIAQRVIENRKLAYQDAFVKMGMAFLDLMKQFMVEPRTVAILGKGGATAFVEIDPEKLQDAFDVFYDIQGDSLNRQERRAEAQSLYQMVLQAAPIHAQFASPINLDAFLEKLLVAFDEPNPQKYMQTRPQAQAAMAPPGAPGMPPGVGSPAGMNPQDQGMLPPGQGPMGSQGNGVTAPPGPGVNQNDALQQMLASSGPQQ